MRGKNILAGLYFIVMFVLLGLTVGGVLGSTIFASESDMGWDQLANFLGGVMVGGVASLAVAAFTVSRIDARRRLVYGSAFLVAVVLIVAALRITAAAG